MSIYHAPSSVVILGSGVFGLSTLYALLLSPNYTTTRISLISPCPLLPNIKDIHNRLTATDVNKPFSPSSVSTQSTASSSQYHEARHTASHDTSRLVRADYASLPYARLAARAQQHWRNDPLFKGHYHESGLVVVGGEYAKSAQRNVEILANNDGANIEVLKDRNGFRRVLGSSGGGNGGGDIEGGYVNWSSGWADASGAMNSLAEEVYQLAKTRKDVHLITGRATRLIFGNQESHIVTPDRKPKVLGVQLEDGKQIHADLTIAAMGPWSPALGGLDLRGKAEASGQCIAYIQLIPSEIPTYAKMPGLINTETGIYIIPPDKLGRLKIAQHGFGYRNPVRKISPSTDRKDEEITISLPSRDFSTLPPSALSTLRRGLHATLAALSSHPFSETRLCWYTDTPTGDFLIDYHPNVEGLFIATGGSGHAFKFLPVLGEAVVGVLEGKGGELRELWRWRDGERKGDGWLWTADGSRGGKAGMILEEEMRRREGGGGSKL